MSDERKPDWLFSLIMLLSIPSGAVLGGLIGYGELGWTGAVVGVIAGGFAGLVVGWLLGILVAISLIAVVFLGPFAVLVSLYYYFFLTQ